MLLACAALSCFLGPGAALAAEEDDQAEGYRLGEIVVSGKVEGVQATEAVSTVSAEDIRSAGATTLDQALRLLPGVNVRVGGEGVPRIDIRGFRTRHVLLLLDGIPINSAFDQQFDPTFIPTESIAEIKLTRGASSVLYGQGGLGGVIDIATRRGTDGLHGVVTVEAGDHEPYLARGRVSGGEGSLHYLVSGSATRINAFRLPSSFSPTPEQGPGYRANSDKRRNNVLGSLTFSPSQDLTLGLTVQYAQGSFGKPGSVIRDPLDPFASPPKYARVDDFDNVSAQVAVDYEVTDRLSLRGWAYLNHLSEQDTQYDDGSYRSFDLVAGSFREQVRSTVKGMSVRPRYDLGSAGAVNFLLSAEQDHWDGRGSLTLGPESSSPVNEFQTFNIYSTAVELELSPVPGLGLVAGYGHHWQARGALGEDGYSALAAAYCDVFRDTRVKASFSRNIRFPTLRDLYAAGQGNPSLVAERAYTYEVGLERRLPRNGVASLTAFTTLAKNLIQQDQATGQATNLAEMRFQGFEIAVTASPARALMLRASYAYLDSRDLSRGGREQQQYTPGNKATLQGRYDFDFGLSPCLSLLYVGDQYFYTKSSFTQVQKARLRDIFLVDVKLSQRIIENRMTFYLGASNLLDRNYESSYGFPQPGRFVYGGVDFRI